MISNLEVSKSMVILRKILWFSMMNTLIKAKDKRELTTYPKTWYNLDPKANKVSLDHKAQFRREELQTVV